MAPMLFVVLFIASVFAPMAIFGISIWTAFWPAVPLFLLVAFVSSLAAFVPLSFRE